MKAHSINLGSINPQHICSSLEGAVYQLHFVSQLILESYSIRNEGDIDPSVYR